MKKMCRDEQNSKKKGMRAVRGGVREIPTKLKRI